MNISSIFNGGVVKNHSRVLVLFPAAQQDIPDEINM